MVEERGWRIGVDLGGTRVRAIARDPRDRRRELTAPSPGLAGLPALLERRWALRRGAVAALVVASKGVWTAGERRRWARRLRGLGRRVRVIPDVEAAYSGALGERPGVLLLAGTGSMALGRDARGRWARAGGAGPLLGDEGSAFWMGREWLRATMDRRGFAAARRALAAPDPVARVAALAPGVLARARRGSRSARRIVAHGEDALAALLQSVQRELRLRPPLRVSWAGGLLARPGYRDGVWRAARRRGLRVKLAPPRESPVRAAYRIAERLAATGGAPRRRQRPRQAR
jgi:N-acetylglucosamine kinase-like BadF-type ATPase